MCIRIREDLTEEVTFQVVSEEYAGINQVKMRKNTVQSKRICMDKDSKSVIAEVALVAVTQ